MRYDPADLSYIDMNGWRCCSGTPASTRKINRDRIAEAVDRLHCRSDR
jgi:hypothetical protein